MNHHVGHHKMSHHVMMRHKKHQAIAWNSAERPLNPHHHKPSTPLPHADNLQPLSPHQPAKPPCWPLAAPKPDPATALA